jgi:ribonuclease P protein component
MPQLVTHDRPRRRGRPFVSLKSSGFRAVSRRGARFEGDGILIVIAPGDSGPPQVGIVAGRAVGSAVRRNHAKRRLREAMAQVELRPDTAYIVVASAQIATMPFGVLVDRLASAIAGSEDSRE